MRVLDRLTAVAVALAFALVGLGVPACAETPLPGAVVTAAHRSIVHDEPHVVPPDAWHVYVAVTTPHRPAPSSPVADRLAHPASGWLGDVSGGPCGDHRVGVDLTDGPDDLLLAVPVRIGGPSVSDVAPTRYLPPAAPLPPRGTLPARAPPAIA